MTDTEQAIREFLDLKAQYQAVREDLARATERLIPYAEAVEVANERLNDVYDKMMRARQRAMSMPEIHPSSVVVSSAMCLAKDVRRANSAEMDPS